MNEKITLERRLTHRYNVGWSHLDDIEYVGTARLVSSHTKHNDGESQRVFSLLLVTSGEDEQSIKDAIRDTMQSGCRCEHDCCGHWQTSVDRVRRIKGGNCFAVLQSSYRNV